MSTFSLGTEGKKIIKDSEGYSLKFYGDPKGYPTVGWGHLITSSKTYTKNTTGNPEEIKKLHCFVPTRNILINTQYIHYNEINHKEHLGNNWL